MIDKRTQDWIDLGRRAAACKAWRWLPGMLVAPTVLSRAGRMGHRYGLVYEDQDGALHVTDVEGSDYPDLRDPATVGALLTLVRRAWGDHEIYARPDNSYRNTPWAVVRWSGGFPRETRGASESEALVAALESAP